MKPSKNNQHDQAKKFADLDLKDVDSYTSFLEKLLETLQSKINVLPKVDDKGRSECPFAENLYAQKEEATSNVIEELKKASRYLALLEQEISRLRQNLAQIESDTGALHLDQAKEKYITAKRSQEIHIEKNIHRKMRLSDLIARAEKLMQLAHKKKWPGGKPKERFRTPPLMAGGPTGVGATGFQNAIPDVPLPPSPAFKTEIDSLMTLGPLGKKNI
jgi:hypothetical protein